MTDVLTPSQRSYNMSQIKASKTKPELKLKKTLQVLGFAYQPKMYGRPDFSNKKEKIIIFIDGCFWHRCPKHFIKPKSNIQFWTNKIKQNVQRDKKVTQKLRSEGWKVIRIWEHEVNKIK